MANEKDQKEDQRSSKDFSNEKRFYIRIAIVAVVIFVGYYVMSPYQNCLRDGKHGGFCTVNTGW